MIEYNVADAERERLFGIIREQFKWENTHECSDFI